MRYHDATDGAGFLRALARSFASFLFNASNEDEEPMLDTFRGFRDPDEQPRRDRRPDWNSSGRSFRAI